MTSDYDSMDVGNQASTSSSFGSFFTALGDFTSAAAPIVTSLSGKKSDTSPTTAQTAAAQQSATKYLVIGIAAVAGAILLGVLLFTMRRGR